MPTRNLEQTTLPLNTWLNWLVGATITLVSLTSFFYMTFTTKQESQHYEDELTKRLDRMENKLDRLLTH